MISPQPNPAARQPDRLTQITLLLLSTLTIMSGATIAPALPAIQEHFSAVPNAAFLVKLLLTILGVVIALTAPLSGLLTDRLGRRSVLLVALGLYILGGASGLVMESIGWLLVGRVILGLGVAGTMTTTAALINDLFRGPPLSQFLSWQSAFSSFGGALLFPLSGLLATLSWHMPFALYLLPVLLLPLAWRLPNRMSQQSAAATNQPTELQGRPNWHVVGIIYLVAFGYMLLFYVVPTQGPFIMRSLGASPQVTGWLLALFTMSAGAVSLFYSRFAARFLPTRMIPLGLAMLAAGLWWVSQAHSLNMAWPGLLVGGLGAGLIIPSQAIWLAEFTPLDWRGRVAAGMTSAIFLGQFLSPLVFRSAVGHEAQSFALSALGAAALATALLLYGLFISRPVTQLRQ